MIEFDPTLVHDWLSRSARRFPDREALVIGDEHWNYKTMDEHTSHFAGKLMNVGVKRHDRVVVLLNTSSETVISIYGILKAGAAFVSLDSSMKHAKLSFILNNCGANVLITHVQKAAVVLEALKNITGKNTIIWVGPKKQIPDCGKHLSLSWDDIFSDVGDSENTIKLPCAIDVDLATLIYTSGSTGEPKGVMTSHFNMISAARSIIQYVDNSVDDRIFNVLPLSFDYGLYQVIMAFMFGGTVILESSFLYIHNILQTIEREKATGFPVVPTIVAMLLQLQDLSKYNFRSLKYITNTAAALPVEHIRKLRQLFPDVKIISMYGLTECKRVSYLDPEKLDQIPASVGKAMPNSEVFIVDENGQKAEPGKSGELHVRGSNVMQGYWNDPELTQKIYVQGIYPGDRLLRSGDFFKMDEDGFLYFLGRKDDMIKTRGERVSPREIEDTLCKMAGIAEVAIIGVSDEILGQSLKAFVVAELNSRLDETAILQYCAANLESFAVPKRIVMLQNLPKTGNGKIDKKKLLALKN